MRPTNHHKDNSAWYTGAEPSFRKNKLVNKFDAYAVRNSFESDFDPVAGCLWYIENDLDYGNEINLVEPDLNSGCKRQQGSLSLMATGILFLLYNLL
jgi:hypothetical protein